MTARSATFRAKSFSPTKHKLETTAAAETRAVWFISVERFECIARLFSGNLCASHIASKALHQSKLPPDQSLVVLRIKMELSQSGLQQSNGFTVISFKSQLSDLDSKAVQKKSARLFLIATWRLLAGYPEPDKCWPLPPSHPDRLA